MLLTNGAKDAADGLPPSNDGNGESATDRQSRQMLIHRDTGDAACVPDQATRSRTRIRIPRSLETETEQLDGGELDSSFPNGNP